MRFLPFTALAAHPPGGGGWGGALARSCAVRQRTFLTTEVDASERVLCCKPYFLSKVLLCVAAAVLENTGKHDHDRQTVQILLVVAFFVLLLINVCTQPCSEKGGLAMNAYRSGTLCGVLLMALCAYVRDKEDSTSPIIVYSALILPVLAAVIHLAKESLRRSPVLASQRNTSDKKRRGEVNREKQNERTNSRLSIFIHNQCACTELATK